jgi:hypothetical protein
MRPVIAEIVDAREALSCSETELPHGDLGFVVEVHFLILVDLRIPVFGAADGVLMEVVPLPAESLLDDLVKLQEAEVIGNY